MSSHPQQPKRSKPKASNASTDTLFGELVGTIADAESQLDRAQFLLGRIYWSFRRAKRSRRTVALK